MARLLLIVMADQCDNDGRGAALSKASYAEVLGVSESSVYAKLRDLTKAGLIAPGDQRVVAYLPANRRPTVYDLPRVARARKVSRRRSRGADPAPQTGVQQGCNRGAPGVQLSEHDSLESLHPQNPAGDGGATAAPAAAGRADPDPALTPPEQAPARFRHAWASSRAGSP